MCVCLSSYASHISSEIFNCDSIFYICIHPSIRCARLYWLTNLPHCKKKPLTHMCDWRTYTNVQLHIYTYMSYIHRQTHIPSNPFHQIYIQNSKEYEWTYDNICPIFMGDENMLKYHTMLHCIGINSKYTFFFVSCNNRNIIIHTCFVFVSQSMCSILISSFLSSVWSLIGVCRIKRHAWIVYVCVE